MDPKEVMTMMNKPYLIKAELGGHEVKQIIATHPSGHQFVFTTKDALKAHLKAYGHDTISSAKKDGWRIKG